MSPGIQLGRSTQPDAPLAIVISQPEPTFLFADSPHATRVKLAITRPPPDASAPGDGLIGFNPGFLSPGHGLLDNPGATWSVTVELEQQLAQSLAAIGQIHCRDGYFSAAGYTASGCQIANGGEQLRLGGSFSPSPGFELGLGLFRQSTVTPADGTLSPLEQGAFNATLLASPLTAHELQPRDGSGLDMGLHLNTGDLPIGRFQMDVAMAEYLDRQSLRQTTAYDFSPPWLGTNDLQRQTRLHLGWSKGAFSGGVEGIYQVYQPGLLNTPGNDWSTFNLYFSWNTPWNGRFSIGATNVLDTSLEDNANQQPDPRQPLDGVFGRVPYVRYKQDL